MNEMKSIPKRDAVCINEGQAAKGVASLAKGYPVKKKGIDIIYSYITKRDAKITG